MHRIPFKLIAEYEPAGDQPQAIEKLVEGLQAGLAHQTLLGVTGSGKTYTVAQVIQRVQRPTLPVLFVTGFEELVSKAADYGRVLVKPVELDALVAAVRRELAKSR